VHVAPGSSGDVPDEREARLVVLAPEHAHMGKATDSPARQEAERMLDSRGTAPRLYRNALSFLVPDRTRLGELEQAVRQYLAWKSIEEEREQLNLDAFQSNQTKTKREQAEEAVRARIPETYSWALVPTQPDPQGGVEWVELRLQGGQGPDSLAARAGRKLKGEELLITELAALRLRYELDRALWQGREHLGLKQLWDYLASYLYLPRLRDETVLVRAIESGIAQLTWADETFAYAEGWDEAQGRYKGLVYGQHARVVFDGQSVLVKPEAALRQINSTGGPGPGGPGPGGPGPGGPGPGGPGPQPLRLRRFHGVAELDTTRMGRDAGRIAEEIVQHLTTLQGSRVRVRLEIEAEIPDGAPENVVRTVSENGRTLKFVSQGFEEE